MVRALLDGRKTQTRRILKPKKNACLIDGGWTDDYVLDPGNREWLERYYRFRVGDRLYVRETWRALNRFNSYPVAAGSIVAYEADDNHGDRLPAPPGRMGRKRPSIHMPRWASRLTLIVTDVRVQRLCDITDEDATAEGFKSGRLNDGFGPRDIGGGYTVESPGTHASAVGMFLLTWQELHPEWDGYSSPWIVALTFTVERANIDSVKVAA